MKKKYFWSLLTIMMVTMLSVSITSCSSSDDEGSNSFDIVGTWRNANTKAGIRTFNADGTYEGSTYSNWKISNGKLLMTRSNNGRIEEWQMEYKDNLLYLTLPDGAATEQKALEKINLANTRHLTSEYFVGKWQEGRYDVWEFMADGRCSFESNSGAWPRVGNGNWSFYEETQTLKATTTDYYIYETGKSRSYTTNWEWEIIYATYDDFTGNFGFIRLQ